MAHVNPNGQVLLALKSAGADLNLPHKIDHCFIGSNERLLKLAAHLSLSGLAMRFEKPTLLIAAEWMLLNSSSIDLKTDAMAKLADQFLCEYDGWGTVPQKSPLFSKLSDDG